MIDPGTLGSMVDWCLFDYAIGFLAIAYLIRWYFTRNGRYIGEEFYKKIIKKLRSLL